MVKIIFVCHGNICRSPMAEFVFKDMVSKKGLCDKFEICSAATSTEAIGSGVHYGTKRKLAEVGISTEGKYAQQFTKSDYRRFDYIIVMDSNNMRNLMKIIDNDNEAKVYKLLDFDDGGDIADPWYTGDFDQTYDDVMRGCIGLFEHICENKLI